VKGVAPLLLFQLVSNDVKLPSDSYAASHKVLVTYCFDRPQNRRPEELIN